MAVSLSVSYSLISAGFEIFNNTKNSVEQDDNIKTTYYSEVECVEKHTVHVSFDVQQLKLLYGVVKLLHDLNTETLSDNMNEKCCNFFDLWESFVQCTSGCRRTLPKYNNITNKQRVFVTCDISNSVKEAQGKRYKHCIR